MPDVPSPDPCTESPGPPAAERAAIIRERGRSQWLVARERRRLTSHVDALATSTWAAPRRPAPPAEQRPPG